MLFQLKVEHALEEYAKFELTGLCRRLAVIHEGAWLRPASLLARRCHMVVIACRSDTATNLSLIRLASRVLGLCLLRHQFLTELTFQEAEIVLIVHFFNYTSPLPVFDETLAAEDVIHHCDKCTF